MIMCRELAVCFIILMLIFVPGNECQKPDKKKDIRDYSDADIERLYEQWEESDDDPLPVDELPEWHPDKPRPELDVSKMGQFNDPEELLKYSKKGKSLMMFVKVGGNPTRTEADELTSLWQTGLRNNHVLLDRFLLDDNRAIFMFKDGGLAWDAKDFLVEQEGCEEVVIEQKTYKGKIPDRRGPEQKTKKEKETRKKDQKDLTPEEIEAKRLRKEEKRKEKEQKKEDQKDLTLEEIEAKRLRKEEKRKEKEQRKKVEKERNGRDVVGADSQTDNGRKDAKRKEQKEKKRLEKERRKQEETDSDITENEKIKRQKDKKYKERENSNEERGVENVTGIDEGGKRSKEKKYKDKDGKKYKKEDKEKRTKEDRRENESKEELQTFVKKDRSEL